MSGIDDFFGILDAHKKTMSWALGGSAILPLIGSFTGLAPLWPPGIALLTSLYTLIMVIMSFQFFRYKPKKTVNRIMLACLIFLTLSLMIYIFLLEKFTFKIPTNGEVIYVGCGWTELAKSQSEKYMFDPLSGCPGEFERVLQSIQYEAKIIWNRDSLTYIKFSMVCLWLAFFSGVALFVSSFLVYQQKRK